jgi:hypothetical protein
MMLADAIGNVSLDSISNYAALDGHGGPLVAGGGDLVERSIRMGFEANGQAPAGCWHLMVLGLCVMIGRHSHPDQPAPQQPLRGCVRSADLFREHAGSAFL